MFPRITPSTMKQSANSVPHRPCSSTTRNTANPTARPWLSAFNCGGHVKSYIVLSISYAYTTPCIHNTPLCLPSYALPLPMSGSFVVCSSHAGGSFPLREEGTVPRAWVVLLIAKSQESCMDFLPSVYPASLTQAHHCCTCLTP